MKTKISLMKINKKYSKFFSPFEFLKYFAILVNFSVQIKKINLSKTLVEIYFYFIFFFI